MASLARDLPCEGTPGGDPAQRGAQRARAHARQGGHSGASHPVDGCSGGGLPVEGRLQLKQCGARASVDRRRAAGRAAETQEEAVAHALRWAALLQTGATSRTTSHVAACASARAGGASRAARRGSGAAATCLVRRCQNQPHARTFHCVKKRRAGDVFELRADQVRSAAEAVAEERGRYAANALAPRIAQAGSREITAQVIGGGPLCAGGAARPAPALGHGRQMFACRRRCQRRARHARSLGCGALHSAGCRAPRRRTGRRPRSACRHLPRRLRGGCGDLCEATSAFPDRASQNSHVREIVCKKQTRDTFHDDTFACARGRTRAAARAPAGGAWHAGLNQSQRQALDIAGTRRHAKQKRRSKSKRVMRHPRSRAPRPRLLRRTATDGSAANVGFARTARRPPHWRARIDCKRTTASRDWRWPARQKGGADTFFFTSRLGRHARPQAPGGGARLSRAPSATAQCAA